MPLTLQKSIDRVAELAAVVFSLAYTLLYLREVYQLAFVAAIIGSAIFVVLCWKKKIYAESALHVFYIGMAVFGLFEWGATFEPLPASFATHAPWLFTGVAATAVLGFFLQKFSDARLPYLDAFTTVFSLIATWFMVTFVHENWLYWIVIDAVAIFLYAYRRMPFAALLFVVYLLMAIDGYFEQINWF
jgi:nicotinamide mononucleotide transporter